MTRLLWPGQQGVGVGMGLGLCAPRAFIRRLCTNPGFELVVRQGETVQSEAFDRLTLMMMTKMIMLMMMMMPEGDGDGGCPGSCHFPLMRRAKLWPLSCFPFFTLKNKFGKFKIENEF